MSVLLSGISEQVTQIWTRGESQNQHRVRARVALQLIGREMKQALVPLDATNMKGFQFVINSPTVSAGYPDSVFWQAAVAKDKSSGDIAEVGYFIRWTAGEADLCRFYVPSGNSSYLIYNLPAAWVTDALLEQVAPATQASSYQGLFLQNVVGFWVIAYAANGTAYVGTYDSRTNGNLLPAYVDVSLALLDDNSSARMKNSATLAAAVQKAGQSAANAGAFLALLDVPSLTAISRGASAATFRVLFSDH